MLLIILVGTVGVALAENAVDEARVDNGTMDLLTTIEGTLFVADQSVSGTGFTNINNNFGVVDPDDKDQVLNLKTLSSGTGDYKHSNYIYVQNNSITTSSGEFDSSDHKITVKDDINAVYAPVSFQFPGSFKIKTIKSLWKDQTYAKNFGAMITMDSLYDYARALKKESTTTMSSDEHDLDLFEAAANSTATSNMDITSNFDGSAHLGATLSDVRGGISGITKIKPDSTVLMDEDYRGVFNLTKKMAVSLTKTTDYGYYEKNREGVFGVYLHPEYDDYPWLPCLCNTGWDDMAIHDQRYHSAKGFFDCTTCLPPGPCKN
jgi:hypothetical protein